MSSPCHRVTADTGARLGAALLAYMLGVTLIVTLLPFQFEWPAGVRVRVSGGWVDFIANVVLFVPLGFLYRLTRPRGAWSAMPCVLGIGALASACIEAAQLFEPARDATLFDVIANTCGMGLGAAAFGRIARVQRLGGRLTGWLAPELPLMALVYLLVPLLWVNTLAIGRESLRIVGTLLVGAFGAAIVGGIQRCYLGPAGVARPRDTAAFTVVWFLAAAFATLRWQPLSRAAAVLIASALALGALSWVLGTRRPPAAAANRRFEVELLRSAAPLYAAYLAAIVAAPLLDDSGAWHFQLGFAGAASNRREILRLLELAAAFTLVGYMAAEMRGRAETCFAAEVGRLTRWGAGLALAVEVAHGYHPELGGSLAHGLLLAAATVYGGWLYHLQRAHVVQHFRRGEPRDASFPTMR